MSASGFGGYLKGKSSQMIFERWANARFKYRNKSFWCRGYYVDTVGKNSKAIGEYIRNQIKEDHIAEQLELELEDSFIDNVKKEIVVDIMYDLGVALKSGLCPKFIIHGIAGGFLFFIAVVFMYNKATIREKSIWDKNCLIMTIQI